MDESAMMFENNLRHSELNIVKNNVKRKFRIMLWGLVIPHFLFKVAKERATIRK